MLTIKKTRIILWMVILGLSPHEIFAMHIMEGFLPPTWSIFWVVCALPFVWIGMRQIRKRVEDNPKLKVLLAVAGAFTLVLSALKIPSVTGSCSHPTGIGFGTILFGPFIMSVMGTIVLLFQAVLLAHGGITTLGANVFSMAVIGALVVYGTFRGLKSMGAPLWLAIFVSAFLGDLATYVTTAVQLSLAFPSQNGGVLASLWKFLGIFAVTQVPLAIIEGIVTYLLYDIIMKYNPGQWQQLADTKILK